MRKFIYTLTGMAFLLAGCSTDEIDLWNEKGYVWFTEEYVDFSFLTLDVEEGDTYRVPIPFTTATTLSDEDRVVEVEIVREPSDSRTTYELETPVLFHAGYTVDTMYVKVTNSSHLYDVHDTISFQVVPSEDFEVGLSDLLTTSLCLYNGYSQPDWWDSTCEFYFGYFTQLKMEVYVAVTGGTDDPADGSSWTNNINVTYLVVMLNDYVAENNIRYPDDDPNAPGEQPSFSAWSY